MFGQQKEYVLFFRTRAASKETPVESRIYQCELADGVIQGTRKQVREHVKDYIPIFIDGVKIDEIQEQLLPMTGSR